MLTASDQVSVLKEDCPCARGVGGQRKGKAREGPEHMGDRSSNEGSRMVESRPRFGRE